MLSAEFRPALVKSGTLCWRQASGAILVAGPLAGSNRCRNVRGRRAGDTRRGLVGHPVWLRERELAACVVARLGCAVLVARVGASCRRHALWPVRVPRWVRCWWHVPLRALFVADVGRCARVSMCRLVGEGREDSRSALCGQRRASKSLLSRPPLPTLAVYPGV